MHKSGKLSAIITSLLMNLFNIPNDKTGKIERLYFELLKILHKGGESLVVCSYPLSNYVKVKHSITLEGVPKVANFRTTKLMKRVIDSYKISYEDEKEKESFVVRPTGIACNEHDDQLFNCSIEKELCTKKD